MIDHAHLLIFLTAALLLAIAPGPGMLYVLARSLAGGRREGLLSALGTFAGGMVHVVAAAAGISIILARSAVAFSAVKYLGGAYLCFLGVRMILQARNDATSNDQLAMATIEKARNPFWQGVLTEVLNPKTALFFLSFIPQFVNRSSGHVFLQFVLLGTFSVTLNTTADIVVTLLAGTARPAHSEFRPFPPSPARAHRRRHDRPRHLSSFWGFEIRSLLNLDYLVIVAIGADR
jgi:threonine/homoserine/homoserine lactone efflux protein